MAKTRSAGGGNARNEERNGPSKGPFTVGRLQKALMIPPGTKSNDREQQISAIRVAKRCGRMRRHYGPPAPQITTRGNHNAIVMQRE